MIPIMVRQFISIFFKNCNKTEILNLLDINEYNKIKDINVIHCNTKCLI